MKNKPNPLSLITKQEFTNIIQELHDGVHVFMTQVDNTPPIVIEEIRKYLYEIEENFSFMFSLLEQMKRNARN